MTMVNLPAPLANQYTAIISSGVDMIVVVVIRYFGGIKLGTGGLVRAYSGVALECLKGAETHIVKPKLQHFHVEDIKQDYDTGRDGFVMLTFIVDYEKIVDLENAINSTCSRKIEFLKL
ncbi:hypothetical protein HPP92_016126 [Vanilla planifolia]|uniref:Impact N-terminal domain-containing protein n=1 Tax=Vanilla planifolia TaxID=51239 RepID=A0A835UT23_VANPL|nr:hypothetical protein HPP92_016126 [Vanilla planifolia]